MSGDIDGGVAFHDGVEHALNVVDAELVDGDVSPVGDEMVAERGGRSRAASCGGCL